MDQPTPQRQTRKRLATRQRISDVATALFIERGFDKVTVDEIAEAADVSRMTVFNHFARKEDMFFDLDDEARADLLSALENRAAGTSPIEVIRLFAHWAVAERRPYVQFSAEGTENFLNTVQSSDSLKARALAIREELTDLLTLALAEAAGSKLPDASARLASSLLVATWVVASLEAHRVFGKSRTIKKSNEAFLSLVDQGVAGAKAAVAGTRYS
jgi:AcrR family transcriptional regulator